MLALITGCYPLYKLTTDNSRQHSTQCQPQLAKTTQCLFRITPWLEVVISVAKPNELTDRAYTVKVAPSLGQGTHKLVVTKIHGDYLHLQ